MSTVTARANGNRDSKGNYSTGYSVDNSNAFSCHGKSASKKSFDELAAEKGIKTFSHKR